MKNKEINKEKKRYHKPVIESEKIYEESALACGKDPATARRRGFGNPCVVNTKS